MELCSEAGELKLYIRFYMNLTGELKLYICFYINWNRVPSGFALEGDASFEKVCSKFGQIYAP